jgi:hypothetical protein
LLAFFITESSNSFLIEFLEKPFLIYPAFERSRMFMDREKIEVIAYSGYRGEETPMAFKWRGTKVEVAEIQSRWIEEGIGDRKTKRGFKLRGTDSTMYTLIYDEETREWFCESGRDDI